MLSFAVEFPIKHEHPSANFLRAVQDWVLGSPHTRFSAEELAGIDARDEWSARNGDERLDVLRASSRSHDSAAVKYTRNDSDLQWVTTIAFSRTTSDSWVSIRVSCESSHPAVRLPPAKKPVVVRTLLVTIRTSQDRWIAFPRTKDDTKWGTLRDVNVVVAVAVDDPANPRFAQVHMIDAKEMRDRFDRAYAARRAADHTIPLKRGVWLSLYDEEGTSPVQRVGAGAGIANPAIAVVPLGEPDTPVAPTKQPNWASDVDEQSLTIAPAKTKLARTFGVDPSSIKITVEA